MTRRSASRAQRGGVAPLGVDLAEPDGGAWDVVTLGQDGEPFEEFYRREFPQLLVLARALVGSAQAEDVVQETMLATYRKWRTISQMRSPVGYVRGICLHKAVTLARRRALERRVWGRLSARAQTVTIDELPEDSRRFWDHVRSLPHRQAQSVALHYALDLPVAEIAEVLDCAEGTVKVHLHRARTSLSASLSASLRLGEEDLP